MDVFKLTLVFLLGFMLLSPVFADGNNVAHVVASDFVFVYSDGITDKYEGDLGLEYALFNDTLTGDCYNVSKNFVRGIAFVTDRKFDIKNFSFEYVKYINDDTRYITDKFDDINITLDNGTVIKPLSIDMDLTPRQKKYFDDYDTQLRSYYDNQIIDALNDNAFWAGHLDSEISVSNRIASNKKSSGSFYGYTSGGGYMYGHYS